MSDTGLSTEGWLAGAVTVILSALGGTVAGARYGKAELIALIAENAKTVKLNQEKADVDKLASLARHSEHEAQIREIRTCADNTSQAMDKIEAVTMQNNNLLQQFIGRGQ